MAAGLSSRSREVEGPGYEAHFLAGLTLVAHVYLRSRVLTHQDHCEPRSTAPGADPGPDVPADIGGESFAVYELGWHGTLDPCGYCAGLSHAPT